MGNRKLREEGEETIKDALLSRLWMWEAGAQCSWGPSDNLWRMPQNYPNDRRES